jgi:hypothetical protein
VDYQPMTIAKLAAFVAAEANFDARWRLVVEFLKEYRHEPTGKRQQLLADAPGTYGRRAVGRAARRPRRAPGDAGRAGRARLVGVAEPAAVLVPDRAPGAGLN